MAKFKCDLSSVELDDGRHGGTYAELYGSGLSADDLLSVLRPAAQRLVDHYKSTIARLFRQHTGSLAGSIQAKEASYSTGETQIIVGPTGKHKGSSRAARSRAGSKSRRYAKHNRDAKATAISNAELAYLLEFGTPRIAATHWMENANKEIEDEIQQMIEDEFHKLLDRKGL